MSSNFKIKVNISQFQSLLSKVSGSEHWPRLIWPYSLNWVGPRSKSVPFVCSFTKDWTRFDLLTYHFHESNHLLGTWRCVLLTDLPFSQGSATLGNHFCISVWHFNSALGEQKWQSAIFLMDNKWSAHQGYLQCTLMFFFPNNFLGVNQKH